MAMAVTLSVVLGFSPARAQTILRDAEIEYALRQIAAPVIRPSGLPANSIRIIVVKDSRLNAFVVDSRSIFITSGLFMKLDNAAQLQGVIAHEAAHIANGHIARRISNARAAGNAALLGLLLSAAVAVGGSPDGAAGIAAGTASAAERAFLGHTRAEESSADQAAVRYMAAAGVEPQPMLEVLEIFRGQEALSPNRQDPYVRTHPLSRDRIRALQGFAAAQKGKGKADATVDYWFQRSKAKLSAFLRNPSFTLRRVKKSDTSDAALIARAVAYHRMPKTKAALAEIDKLVARRPQDPFVHELKGQILLESRQFRAAAGAYATATKLRGRDSQILAGYGRALLAGGGSPAQALKVLEQARARDFRDPRLLRDLAVAYAKTGNPGMASLATAERYALVGDFDSAGIHAKRAEDQLPRGSTGWRRAQDILISAEQAKKRRKR